MTKTIATGAARSIGDILIATGRLKIEDAARIGQLQQENNMKFGDAAISLNLLKKEDIDFALSQQFDYSYLSASDTSLSFELVAAYKPFSRIGENLRAIRSQLILRWLNASPIRKALTIVSPDLGEGRSFLAANLAIVFAQQGERTLLIDGDMRNGRQQSLFKLGKSAGLSGLLAARAGIEAAIPIQALPGLFVLPAGAPPPNPQELLGRAAFGGLLKTAAENFDVIIIDTPAAEKYADAEIIAARTGSAICIARKNKSFFNHSAQLSRRLQDGGVVLVGSVLNDE